MGNITLSRPLVFVDIETDGLSSRNGHVIEVAAIRVENGHVVAEFQSLVDPGVSIPYYITRLTGITDNDVRRAPGFNEIADELAEILDGAVFVAHNVGFDYSFLAEEFRRVGSSFVPERLCTARLSRVLYPQQRTHKLADLIERHSFTYSARHRAYDDAHVLWQFIQHIHDEFAANELSIAFRRQISSL